MALEQAFLRNGLPADSMAFEREDFASHSEYLMATAQVWVWRRRQNAVEVLLQKRAMSKKKHPGKFSTSIAGHIDQGENVLETACREFQEELGWDVDKSNLEFIFSLFKTDSSGIIANTYLYEAPDDFAPVFNDGEVESVQWVTLRDFKDMTSNPDAHNLVNHCQSYFVPLIEHLQLKEGVL